MPKRQWCVRLIDGSIHPCELVEKLAWNPDRGCRVGFARIGDREVAVTRARGEDAQLMQLGAQILPGGPARGMSH